MIIRFPNMHFYIEGVPRAFRIFGLEVTLFGVMTALGMLLAVFTAWMLAKRQGKDPNRVLGAAMFSVVGGLIGARLLYVFCNWELYKADPMSILSIRDGGLAFYGALIGGMLSVGLFCALAKCSYLQIVDVLAPALALGQAVGRWGDYFNRSSFGEYTDGFWAMQIPLSAVRSAEVTDLMREHLTEARGVTYVQVTPLFLLESLLCFALFLYLLGCSRHRRFDGQIYLKYLTWYGLIRFGTEYFRTDQLRIPGLKWGVSQILSAAFAVFFGLDLLVRSSMNRKRAERKREMEEKFLRKEELAEEIERQRAAEAARQKAVSEEDKEAAKEAIRERYLEEQKAAERANAAKEAAGAAEEDTKE